jgi:signal transduction histidine kinase/DNA-binding response OmpR family regulator
MISLNVFTDELSFSGEKQFKYRLIGNNENWINLMPGANVIPLMNLPSGDYELQVEMAECSRLIRCEPAVLFITIGRPFWKQWWAFIMYFVLAGGIALFIYYNIKHDIRQQYMIKQVSYEAAREKELSDMRLQFFMDTSHEIRTPLSLMLGPVRQCIKSDDIGNIKSKLVMVESNGRQLLKLVNQILDYRKFDATGLCANITEGDVSMGMEKMLGGFGYMIRSSGAIITYTSDCAGCICSYDEDFMDKIADNLITNSLKYGGKGVKINLSCNIGRPAGSEEDCIILKISDDGPGIADDEKQHVFERFYRSKKTEKGFAVQQGTGIGLFMVKHYVELMNGTILLEDNNAAGHGCIFTIKIPSMVTDSSLRETKKIIFDGIENEDEEKNAAVSLAPVHNEMIMIVDDNPDFRKYIADIMNPYYHLEMASGGKEAWEKIPGLHPDLVIADQMMPEMDGMELCRRIKESPETSQIPVIILTACADDKNRLEGLQSGADEYLTKPFEWDILNMCIEYLIKQNRLKKEKIMYRSYVSPITSDLAPTDIKLLSDALRYVQDNIKDTALSVEGLSLHLGISRGYLYKKIDYMTGRSVVEFIRLVRLRTAAAMLKEGLLNVSQVAYSVGFNNVKYFSKYFKDEYGITPSMYRKS